MFRQQTNSISTFAFLLMIFLYMIRVFDFIDFLPFLRSNIILGIIWVLVAVGFAVTFLNYRNIFDLAIAVGFALNGLSYFLYNFTAAVQTGFFTLVFIGTLLVWALKLFMKGKISSAISLVIIAIVNLAMIFVLPRFGIEIINIIYRYFWNYFLIYCTFTYFIACSNEVAE